MRRLSPRQLRDYLDAGAPAPLLLDVREPWEFQTCHIAGSQLLPMRQVPGAIGQLDPKRETVVICHHGVRSFYVARFLEQAGSENVVNLDGGVDGWAREVDPGMPVY